VPAAHPYTTGGLEIQALAAGRWVEVGECGLAAPHVLRGAGLSPEVSGLALGVGLDRLLMLRKGIDDIRLLRSPDPRIAGQLRDLAPYRPVSAQPPARRDVSVAVPADLSAEEIGDRVRDGLGPYAHLVEEVRILSVTPAAELPPAARDRLAIRDGQVNVLLRVVLRDLTGTVGNQLANALRDRVYATLHHAGSSPSRDVVRCSQQPNVRER
jgi:phenylalanyl-tRNA synthetase alpha chain